eukprot:5696232-Amphidinium_carterae.1
MLGTLVLFVFAQVEVDLVVCGAIIVVVCLVVVSMVAFLNENLIVLSCANSVGDTVLHSLVIGGYVTAYVVVKFASLRENLAL